MVRKMNLVNSDSVDSLSSHTILYCWSRSSGYGGTEASRSARKIRLTSDLLGAIRMEGHRNVPADHSANVRVVSDSLGKPELYIGTRKGPAVSFSYAPHRIWATACSDATGLGIDVADPSDFGEGYPYHRVFHKDELGLALEVCDGKRKEAAALLWSVKEAILKALGCGLHLIDPLEVRVFQAFGTNDSPQWYAQVDDEARSKVPRFGESGLPVSVFRRERNWVSLAAIFHRGSGQVRLKCLGQV
jgi:phosphopantetheinyl transferase